MHILISALVFILMLGVLVLFHEFGHFSMAKLFRMRVDEFAFGFGPVVAKLFRRGGTDYTIHAIPAGGFVRIAGMEMGEDAEVEGGFNTKPIWQRSLVIFAGPFMSLVLGYLVLVLMGMIWGFSGAGTTVKELSSNSPAAAAGIRAGDTIVAVDGHRVSDSYSMRQVVNRSRNDVISVTVDRGGKEQTFKVKPTVPTIKKLGVRLENSGTTIKYMPKNSPAATAGLMVGDQIVTVDKQKVSKGKDLSVAINKSATPTSDVEVKRDGKTLAFEVKPKVIREESIRLIGVMLNPTEERPGIFGSIARGTVETYRYTADTIRGLFSKQIKDVGGPVMIAYATGAAVQSGPQQVLFLLAVLSIGLAVLNLLPLPIFDGGHLFFLLLEKIRGKRLDPEKLQAVMAFGLVLIVALAIFMVGYDAFRINEWTSLR